MSSHIPVDVSETSACRSKLAVPDPKKQKFPRPSFATRREGAVGSIWLQAWDPEPTWPHEIDMSTPQFAEELCKR